MANTRYETVIGLNKGHKVTKNDGYQNRPSRKKGVSIRLFISCFKILIYFLAYVIGRHQAQQVHPQRCSWDRRLCSLRATIHGVAPCVQG